MDNHEEFSDVPLHDDDHNAELNQIMHDVVDLSVPLATEMETISFCRSKLCYSSVIIRDLLPVYTPETAQQLIDGSKRVNRLLDEVCERCCPQDYKRFVCMSMESQGHCFFIMHSFCVTEFISALKSEFSVPNDDAIEVYDGLDLRMPGWFMAYCCPSEV
jgi:hypothetical protein